jgi:hypothetical protein
MNDLMKLSLTVSGADALAIAQALAARREFSATPPDELTVGDHKLGKRADWRAHLQEDGPTVRASWGDLMQTFFEYMPTHPVAARVPDIPRKAEEAIALLDPLPFELAAFGTVHKEWLASYTAPGFGGFHGLLGWACAFRGAGHDRLVSRRWLDYGPWRLIKGGGDLSFVQFHDLAADAATALEQARPGHERLGIGPSSGYLQDDYVFESDVKGLYLAQERKLVITAADDVSPRAMRDACAARRQRRSDPAQPIDRIAYLFIDAALARRHLHDLWLRELECWALVDGQKRRLDEDYAPVPQRPAWVARLPG